MKDTSFETQYPEQIVKKYATALHATGGPGVNFRYVGPAIKTTVRSRCVQHFEVIAEPEGERLAVFKSANGREAWNSAVIFADNRGLPWQADGSGEIFEPATGRRWTEKLFTAS